MPHVAFVTHRNAPEINDDDNLAAEILCGRGVTVVGVVWDDSSIDWTGFDTVVIRSAWDYHLKADRYVQWLRSFQDTSRCLWNPPQAVLENIHKKYLVELADKGVDVVPTVYLPAAEGTLDEALSRGDWTESVIKPAISACAGGTWRLSSSITKADRDKFAEQLRGQDLLIQPYMPEIASFGEWSLVFFHGEFSHAVLKRPADGDFRVQREYGGNSAPAKPDPKLIEQAQSVLAALDYPLLYARVDGIDRGGRFVLMELEINEPLLFLGYSAGAPQRFTEAILQTL